MQRTYAQTHTNKHTHVHMRSRQDAVVIRFMKFEVKMFILS